LVSLGLAVRQSFIILLATLALSSCDVVTKRYATLTDARRDQLFERGWLPDILPDSTRDIRISSDLDTNRSQGEFWFDPADFAAFTGHLRAKDDSTFEYSGDNSLWVFSCDTSHAHCRYSMQ
jgi:hypothetical protein